MRRLAPAMAVAITWLFLGTLLVVPAAPSIEVDRYGGLGWSQPAMVAEANNVPENIRFQAHNDGTHSLFWEDGEDGGLWHILLDGNGKVLTPPVLAGKQSPIMWTAHGSAPYYASDSSGNIHLTWDTGTEIHYAKLSSQGTVLVDRVLRVNPYGVHGASIFTRPDGQMTVGYISYEAGHSQYRYVLQRLDSAGNSIGENSFPAGDGSRPLDGVALACADGTHVVLATTSGGLYMKLDTGGMVEESLPIPLLPTGILPALVLSPEGVPQLAWNTWESGSSGRIVTARIQGGVVESVHITSPLAAISDPSIAIEATGETLLCWQDSRTGSPAGFYARLAKDVWDSYPANVRIPVSTTTAGAPAFVVDSRGLAWAAWPEGTFVMHVRAYSYGFEASAASDTVVVHPRMESNVGVDFLNIGGVQDTLTVELDASGLPAGWKATLSADEVFLSEDGTVGSITITITGPDGIDGPKTGQLKLTVKSTGNPQYSRTLELPVSLEVSYGAGLTISPSGATASPGSSAQFKLELRNTGDAPDEMVLTAVSSPTLAIGTDASVVPLEWSGAATVGVSAAVSAAAPVGDALSFTISATSIRTGRSVSATGAVIVVPAVQLRLFSLDGPRYIAPGYSDTFQITVANDGNLEGGAQVFLEVVSGAEGWSASIEPASIQVPPGKESPVALTVKAPVNAGAGDRFVVRLKAMDPVWGSLASTTVTAIARPVQGLALGARSLRASGLPGSEVLAPVVVTNTGNSYDEAGFRFSLPGKGWRVEALLGGAVADRLVLDAGARVPVMLAVVPSPEALAGDYTLGVRVEGRSGASAAMNITITVEQYFDVSLYTAAPNMRVVPGETAAAVLHLRNFGNGPDRVSVDARAPAGWATIVRDSDMSDVDSFRVGAGGTANVILELKAPVSTSDAWSDVTVEAFSLSGLRTSLTLRVGLMLPDLGLNVSFSPPRFTEGRSVIATVGVTNTGEAPARSVTVSFQVDGGAMRVERILLIPRDSSKTASFTWTPVPGHHTLKFEVDPQNTVAERDEGNNVVLERVAIAGSAEAPSAITPEVAVAVAVGGVLVAAAAIGGGTEYGKYGLLSFFFLPLYTKIRKDDVLDHFVRGQVYGYIKANPGEHYNSIKKALSLKNGTLVYHLKTLEREEFIKSIIDGRFKRFYPKEMKIPEPSGELVLKMTRIQREILEIIRDVPGISQKDIAARIGLSTPTVHYHIDIMLSARVIRVEHSGRETKCYVEESQQAA